MYDLRLLGMTYSRKGDEPSLLLVFERFSVLLSQRTEGYVLYAHDGHRTVLNSTVVLFEALNPKFDPLKDNGLMIDRINYHSDNVGELVLMLEGMTLRIFGMPEYRYVFECCPPGSMEYATRMIVDIRSLMND